MVGVAGWRPTCWKIADITPWRRPWPPPVV
jgi:hypothetical protein